MPTVKPMKPMYATFENEEQERAFDAWATSTKSSESASAKRVRNGVLAYREMKKRVGRRRKG